MTNVVKEILSCFSIVAEIFRTEVLKSDLPSYKLHTEFHQTGKLFETHSLSHALFNVISRFHSKHYNEMVCGQLIYLSVYLRTRVLLIVLRSTI